ncbi:adenylosuccinate lyase family protein (plasmid) [Paracoccus liaowanqingii]|uniref:Adenylosuccinate lyase family protein n=1 Tax=Paracoccus liaowanqingii TaxID=2560053 RepID=A0A4Y5SRW0_9RHOB|nr:lyase family protein [Paracoccus liaowanqingii]QDA36240.1 adenylosuccinate lyase family protein [Paracoccus liaowanqingii]
MTGPVHNAIYAGLFGDPETEALFSAPAELDAMIRVEVALAQVQSRIGVIPPEAGPAIAAAHPGLRIDPASLAEATARNGVPVPVLVQEMRRQMGEDPQARYLHWGATSQDIMDSALALRLRAALDLWEARLDGILTQLGDLADRHATLPMAARTYGQTATPTSFGATVASWGWPLLDHARDAEQVGRAVFRVSLSGAAGTLSAMGPQAAVVRAGLAAELGLSDPGHGWHSDRSGLGRLTDWVAAVAVALAKLGEDLLLMTQSGLALVRIEGGGASSTMPQKQNPVGPSALVALGRHVTGLSAVFGAAGVHRQNRDGAAWFTEWLTLPQLCISLGAMLRLAQDVLGRLSPDAEAMARDLGAGAGTIHAETLTFAIIEELGLDRAKVASTVSQLCAKALTDGHDLLDLAGQEWPGRDWAELIRIRGLGLAPQEARAFVDKQRLATSDRLSRVVT